jgi:putative toxin-antitoxin system antitoxin component (TIGR02293 family)
MAAVAKIRDLLGGEAVTGPLNTDFDLMMAVRQGLPTAAVERFLEHTQLSFNAIEHHVVARRTFKRRQQDSRPLDPAESDRLVRLARLVAAAEETFGAPEKAQAWLGRENRALGGQSPLSVADTDQGVRSVETLLGRIGHGIAA